MRTFYLLFVTLAAIIAHITAENCLTNNDSQTPNPDGKNKLYTGQQEFSLNLLQSINAHSPNSNIFFSPYSTYHALLMAYFISSNTTEMYLKKVLKLDPKQSKIDVFSAYKLDKLLSSIQRSGDYEFTNANRIYVDKDIQVRSCIPPLFEDELQTQDFQNAPDVSRRNINSWVEERTHNMIKDILPPGSIDSQTNLVLANAAYFKGLWENKFDAANTKLDVFHISPSNRTIVDMMNVQGSFNFDISEELGAHILELPYKGGDISMFILLPPFVKEDGVANILKKLTLEQFQKIVGDESKLWPRTVNVSLPKFNLERTIELVPILDRMNIGDVFTQNSNFSVLTNQKVSLGNALHKAKIEVNEEGTKAAAATVLFSFRSSRPAEPAIFNCKHPFVYIIYDKKEQAILFQGVFRSPY